MVSHSDTVALELNNTLMELASEKAKVLYEDPATGRVLVTLAEVPQTAYVWARIDRLEAKVDRLMHERSKALIREGRLTRTAEGSGQDCRL